MFLSFQLAVFKITMQQIPTIGKVSATAQLVIIIPPSQRNQNKIDGIQKTLARCLDRALGPGVAHRPEENVD